MVATIFREAEDPGLAEVTGAQRVGSGEALAGKGKQEAAADAQELRRFLG